MFPQVMGVITEEQFKSGKCFTGAALPASNPQPKKGKSCIQTY